MSVLGITYLLIGAGIAISRKDDPWWLALLVIWLWPVGVGFEMGERW